MHVYTTHMMYNIILL